VRKRRARKVLLARTTRCLAANDEEGATADTEGANVHCWCGHGEAHLLLQRLLVEEGTTRRGRDGC
jgi:hypothetical protein